MTNLNMTFYMMVSDGVSLSISWNSKLAPVPYATPKLPVRDVYFIYNAFVMFHF